MKYPNVLDPDKVGDYPASAGAGGGYVWDEVLEYRVWCYPRNGAKDAAEGNDYYYPFADYDEAAKFAANELGANEPIALILQREYIDEDSPGEYVHVKQERVTEWPVEFLSRPRRNERTIPDFFAPNAPGNRLEVIRGTA